MALSANEQSALAAGANHQTIYEMRRARRKLTFWRIFTFAALLAVFVAIAWGFGAFRGLGAKGGDHIARISISGTISNDRRLLKLLEDVRKAETVKGVVIAMNSPGGTTVGGEAIYEAMLKLKAEKPVVTSVGTLAASAGYMIAAATDHIIVRRSSIIGSIGVIFTYADATSLLDKIGLEIKDVKTGILKAEPSPYSTAPAEVEPAIRELIGDTYDWFVDIVAENRELDRSNVLVLANGKIFSGTRGVDLKLADEIGGETEAIAYLTDKRDVEKDLPVLDWKIAQTRSGLSFSQIIAGLGQKPISDSIAEAFSLLMAAEGNSTSLQLPIDGLTSIWHVKNSEAN